MRTKLILLLYIIVHFGCLSSNKDLDFPIILQEEPVQCGPVCLKMICQYYGKDVDLKKLEKMSKMSTSGTSLLGLSEASDSLGLKNLAVKISYDQLVNEVPLPAIVHWNNNHFVVVYKASDNKVWVADPNIGKIEYSRNNFCNGWLQSDIANVIEGVALLLEKTDAF